MIVKQKWYVWVLSILILTCGFRLHAGWEKTGSSSYEYKLTSKLSGTTSGNLISYELSLSPPIGQFIVPSTFTNCTKKADTSSNVAGEKVFDPRQASDSDYSFSMSGSISVSGTGTGTIAWSANPKLKEPFWVTPKTQTQIGDNPSVAVSASKEAKWTGFTGNKSNIRIRVEGDNTGTADLFVKNGAGTITATAIDGLGSDVAEYFICRHGNWTIDVGTLELSMPTEGINMINTVIGKIPGMSGKKLSGIAGDITGKYRDFCCDSDKTIKKEFEIKRSLSVTLKEFPKIPIPLPFIPSSTKSGTISNASGSIKVSFDVNFGVWLNPGSISFGGDQKQTFNQCTSIDCFETNISGSWTPSLETGIEAILCAKVWQWDRCDELTGRGSFSSGVSIGLKHKTQDCGTGVGWNGLAKLNEGSGKIIVEFTAINVSWISPSIKIWDEFEI